MISIIPYTDKYAADFKLLNLEWLDKYGLTDDHDLEILGDPKGVILDRGGFIYLASLDGEIIGTAALIREEEGHFELAKMTVAPSFRGKGISKLLIEKCLDTAREARAAKIILYSNSQLVTAIGLYRQYGFQHVQVADAPYITADVKMELHFNV
ncbi:GNAT family N-acetyltransferase [Flavitalea flava]